MPPSPAMRVSPARELRTDNHKRGRSLESGILFQGKDDDLALFNEVQNKERENFLLQSNDDLDDLFSSKLRYFSDVKIGISVPARGESSDLLNAEGDKNDYDWLITPPETPLFRTLDDEAAPVSFAPARGRPRSQTLSLSRSSTMEKTYRSTKGSPSPQRLSASPRSSNSTLNSRNRPFSSTHTSPPPPVRSPSPSIRSPSPSIRSPSPSIRSSSPSRRLSPPPSKPSPAPRSSTPTPRRMSTGSSGAGAPAPSRVRGTSPVKTSRGNSASPKIRAWQSNIPGFSLEAPPNLRTSLADRPASYVRGSSPASRNGSRSGRQSMSPTASRSVSSCQSRDRDQFSNYSKGSFASSGDDDVESMQSVPVSSMNNRAMGGSKKPTKVLSSSAPKRSFDLALRQMERKGGPQNMFRPLLSSVPSSTFYAGKTNTNYRPLASKNSSITTSSNASSDQGTSGALDIEEIEQNQEDVTSDLLKGKYNTMHDEIFAMDQVDEAVPNGATVESTCLDVPEDNSNCQFDIDVPLDCAGAILDKESEYSYVDGALHMEICSKCSRRFKSSELTIEGDQWFCLNCKSSEENKTSIEKGVNTTEELEILECGAQEVQESLQDGETGETHLEKIDEGQDSFIEPSKDLSTSSLKADVQEGTGISLLLKKSSSSSSSSKGYLVQSRSFTASNISYDDFSYVRDSLNSMRSSIGHSSASVSSSVDLGSSKYGRKSDMENYKYETPVKHKRSVSSLSGVSAHGSHVPSITPSFLEDNFENGVKFQDPNKESLASECTESTCTDVEKENSIISKTAHLTPDDREYGDNLTNDQSNLISEEIPGAVLHVSTEAEDAMQSLCVNEEDVVEVEENVDVAHLSSLDVISEMEIENADIVLADSDSDVDSMNSKHELVENSVSVRCNDDVVSTPVEEVDMSVPVNGVLEEPTIVPEGLGETKPRSFSLEEATDTILFCSSIVHNLAYEAANIAIDKEDLRVEPLRPALTFAGKPNPDRRDNNTRSRTKRGPKSQKTRQRKTDLDTKPSPVTVESDGKSTPRIVRSSPSKNDSMIPPKLESKCNCTIM